MKRFLLRHFCKVLGGISLLATVNCVAQSSTSTDFLVSNSLKLSGRIAFSSEVEGRERIFVLDLDSSIVRKVIDGPGNNSAPQWSPNGRSLVFVSDRDGNKEIYVSDWEGASLRRITNTSSPEDHPSWSPDGSKIIFDAATPTDEDKDSVNIFEASIEGGKPIAMTSFGKKNLSARFSPDAKNLLITTNRNWPGWDICLWEIARRHEKCILSGNTTYSRASYSHDGKQIAFSSGSLNEIDIGILNLEEESSLDLVSMPLREYDAVFSPDDKYIAFCAENGKAENFNLYVESIGERKPLALVQTTGSIRSLSWTARRTIELEASRGRKSEQDSKLGGR